MTLGKRVRLVRKAIGLTLEKFGARIEMKNNSVCQIENNKNSLTEQTAKSIELFTAYIESYCALDTIEYYKINLRLFLINFLLVTY